MRITQKEASNDILVTRMSTVALSFRVLNHDRKTHDNRARQLYGFFDQIDRLELDVCNAIEENQRQTLGTICHPKKYTNPS